MRWPPNCDTNRCLQLCDAGFGASGAAGAQAGPWTNNDAALTSAQAHESLPQFIDLILGKTQEAMEAATAAAGARMPEAAAVLTMTPPAGGSLCPQPWSAVCPERQRRPLS